MEPTREALDAYLDPPYRLPIDAPAGAHRQPFTLSNIWAAHPTTPEDERRYALSVDNERMFGYVAADVSAHDMLPLPPPGPPNKDEIEQRAWFFVGSDDESAQIDQKVYEIQFEAWQRHMHRVDRVCWGFSFTLKDMLDHYEGSPRRPYAAPSRLAFDPHVSPLPSYELIDTLSRERAIAHLMLLVARHELGYIVLKGQAWRASSPARLSLSGEPFLTDDDWGLLSARARGHTSIRTGSAKDK